MRQSRQCAAAAVVAVLAMVSARADDVGRIKVFTGTVNIDRAGQPIPGKVGAGLQASDTLVTGADGSAGVTFIDSSRMSVGPGTTLTVNRFSFDQTRMKATSIRLSGVARCRSYPASSRNARRK